MVSTQEDGGLVKGAPPKGTSEGNFDKDKSPGVLDDIRLDTGKVQGWE